MPFFFALATRCAAPPLLGGFPVSPTLRYFEKNNGNVSISSGNITGVPLLPVCCRQAEMSKCITARHSYLPAAAGEKGNTQV